jgi:hypothetical protein
LVLVGEQDVRLAVAVDLADHDAVADLHTVVDGLRVEARLGRLGEGGNGEQAQHPNGATHPEHGNGLPLGSLGLGSVRSAGRDHRRDRPAVGRIVTDRGGI